MAILRNSVNYIELDTDKVLYLNQNENALEHYKYIDILGYLSIHVN